MWLKALNTRLAAEVGASLADRFVTPAESAPASSSKATEPQRKLQSFLAEVDREALPLQLGIFRRARLANSFKSRLLDNGVERQTVDELTRMLLLRLTAKPLDAAPDEGYFTPEASPATPNNVAALHAAAGAHGARGEHAQALAHYLELVKLKPRDLLARNNLGVALLKLGRYQEAAEQFRRAASLQSTYLDAQYNLGVTLRLTGQVVESEQPLRRALSLDSRHVEARVNLGTTLVLLSRLPDARACFEKALQVAPRHTGALVGMGQIASLEGRFEEAEALFKKALVFDSALPVAWAALAGLRKMTSADAFWLKNAERVAASGLAPLEEADLRFAIGKYWDDLGKFKEAFRSYARANALQKSAAQSYDPVARTRFVDDMVRVYSRESFASVTADANDSQRPVFVTGMMRSGTSLVEQIIASHPAAQGAGELPFWNDAMRKHEDAIRSSGLAAPARKKLAETYLSTLNSHAADARRVVDKSTFNADFLGPIHCVLPRARIVYVRRDPLDTCLSCYFHQFSPAHNFAMDLGDLAHYYGEHHRLMAHWRAVLPQGALLEVPYAELVADQEKWTRRIIEFIGLEWDDRCLDFHRTQRPVATASFWQVRQKIFNNSIGRWHNYKKFLGPLRDLQDL